MHKPGDELLIGRILLRLGFLTEKQMAEAVAQQEEDFAPLGRVLVARGYLTSEQLQEALDVQKEMLGKNPFVDAQGDSTLFGKKAVEAGWATAQQVNEALRVQGQAWESDRRILHIGEILMEKGTLDSSLVLSVLNGQGKTLGTCKACRSRFNIPLSTPGEPNACCPLCAGPVEPATSTMESSVGFLEELGILKGKQNEDPTTHYGGGVKSSLLGLSNGPEGVGGLDHDFGISLSFGDSSHRPDDSEPLRNVKDLLASSKTDDRYVVDCEINRGGMGAILSAVDRDIRRQVAMKVMLTKGQVSVDRVKRFVEEAQVTGQLEHPNIVPVHELGVDANGQMYFTMMMVRGKSLSETLKEQYANKFKSLTASNLSKILEVLLKVSDAMAFAHSKGVIHRDLKPANIMVGQFGEVLVMDWGLSRILGRTDTQAAKVVETIRSKEDASKTLDGLVMGTASYMPPEQAEGKLDEIDERSDIYSLGAVLFEMLTLLPPFRGRDLTDIISKVVEGKLQRPEMSAPYRRIPPELAAICMKAMAYEKRDRYASATDFARDVRLYLDGRAVSAKEDTLVESAVKLVRRNKPVFATVGVAFVVVAIVSGVGIKRVVSERNFAQKQRTRAEGALGQMIAADEAKWVAQEKLAHEKAREIRPWVIVYESDFSADNGDWLGKDGEVSIKGGRLLLGPASKLPIGAGSGNVYVTLNREIFGDLRVTCDLEAIGGNEITIWFGGSSERTEMDGYSLTVGSSGAKLQRKGKTVVTAKVDKVNVSKRHQLRFERIAGKFIGYLDGARDPFLKWHDPAPLVGVGHGRLGFYVWDLQLAVHSLQVHRLGFAPRSEPLAFAQKLLNYADFRVADRELEELAFGHPEAKVRAQAVFLRVRALEALKESEAAREVEERFITGKSTTQDSARVDYAIWPKLREAAHFSRLIALLRAKSNGAATWEQVCKKRYPKTDAWSPIFLYLIDASEFSELSEAVKHVDESEKHIKHALSLLPLMRDRKALELVYGRRLSGWGISLVNQGRYEDAIANSKKVLAIDRTNPMAWFTWGLSLNRMGHNEESVMKYQEAVVVDPKNRHAWNNLGWAKNRVGRYKEAVEAHKKVLELDPRFNLGWNQLGWALCSLGIFDEAIEAFEMELKYHPKSYETWNSWGWALDHLGQFSEAAKKFERSGNRDNNLADWARMLCHAGRPIDALVKLEIVKVKPALRVAVGKAVAYWLARDEIASKKNASVGMSLLGREVFHSELLVYLLDFVYVLHALERDADALNVMALVKKSRVLNPPYWSPCKGVLAAYLRGEKDPFTFLTENDHKLFPRVKAKEQSK